MKLCLNLLVRNEVGIIKENVLYHLERGIDEVLILDNKSVDGTLDVLSDLEKHYPVRVFHEEGDNHDQGVWMTRLVERAKTRGADWVMHGDADEFWVAERPIKEVLVGKGVVVVGRRNVIPTFAVLEGKGYRQWKNDVLVVNPYGEHRGDWWGKRSMLLHKEAPKVATSVEGFRRIGHGNHRADVDGEVREAKGLWIAHMALGTFGAFELKVKHGCAAMLRNKRVSVGAWTMFHKAYVEGRLREVYERMVVSEEEAGELVAQGVVERSNPIRRYFE